MTLTVRATGRNKNGLRLLRLQQTLAKGFIQKFLKGCLISVEILARVLHEALVNLVVLRLLITDGLHRRGIKTVDDGLGAGQENWRVGGDDELGVSEVAHLPQESQEVRLAPWRKGCLRFVQKIETFDLVARSEKRHDGLSVGLGDEGLPPKVIDLTGIVCFPFIHQLGKITKDL